MKDDDLRPQLLRALSHLRQEGDQLFDLLLHGRIPGAAELHRMCRAADEVSRWCHTLAVLVGDRPGARDGDWIEPPTEVDD